MPTNLIDSDVFTDPIQGVADADPQAASSYNTAYQGLANRTRYLKTAFEAKYDVAGRVLLPTPMNVERYFGLPEAVAISGWDTSDSFEWVSTANGAEMVWEIAPHFSGFVTLTKVAVLVDPGAARAPGGIYTIGDTMQLALRKAGHIFTITTPAPHAVSDVETWQDDGTSSLQWADVDVSGAPTIGSGQSWQVRVRSSGADSNTLPDKVYGLYVKGTVDRIDTAS